MKRYLIACAAGFGLMAAGSALAGQGFYIDVVNNTTSPATISHDESNCIDLSGLSSSPTIAPNSTQRFSVNTTKQSAGPLCTRFQKQFTFTVSWKANKGTQLKFTQCQVGTVGWDKDNVAQAYGRELTVCADQIKSETVRSDTDHTVRVTLEE